VVKQAFSSGSISALLVALLVVCCTKLEDGRDDFRVGPGGTASDGATNDAGGKASEATPAGASANGGATANDDPSCIPFDNQLRLPQLVHGALPELPPPAPVSAPPQITGAGGDGGDGGAEGSPGGGSGAGHGGGSGTGGSGGGSASFACATLAATGTAIYVTGSSAAKPFLQQIAQQLAPLKVFVVYTSVGSCSGVDAIVNGTPMQTGPEPLPAAATYWDSPASMGKACDLPAQGVAADLGISDVFAQSCSGFELSNLQAAQIRDAHGPIQTMTFAVPSNSKYSEISQQAAYLVFGFGADADVRDPSGQAPIWNDELALLQRSATSGTQAMLSIAIGLPATRWKGKPNKSSDDVAAALQAAASDGASASAALGILAADYIDSRNLRAQIRALAYQDSHGACAVYPDSTSTAKDKRNVRDGLYPIWGPLHLLYKLDPQGSPSNPENRQQLSDIIGYLSGSKKLPNGVELIDVYAQSGVIPECAMHVTRAGDGGAIMPYRPDSPCSCLFEAKATGSSSCSTCKVQGDCKTTESCSQGYCEP
jgi:hypothetical protein